MSVSDSDIAIIGMACRFPGADSVDRFWEVLSEGRETLTRYTDEELTAAGVPADRLADPRYVKAAQTIAGTDLFDSELFRFTHDEAEILDPQHRVFLECALEALERSGYDPARTDAQIGVYAGAGMNTYLLHNLGERYRGGSSVDRYRLMLANDKDFLSTRVSYKLDLTGPSVNISTACSTSLVSVHTACLALLGGECDMALVGAVHLNPPGEGYQYQEGMIFSPDGHCRAFDAEARGTVIGSGAGAVVLKRLKEALADGDWIHAVIKGSAVNNDGSAKTGYTAPSVSGQAAVIADAHEVADVEPDTIGYVEAHGTGTPLGDPIEVAALTEAFRHGTERSGYCALGSVKTNVGHLDTAAGMAGLIKTALMLEHRTLVPSLHFSAPNPDIDFASSPFFVNTAKTEWAPGEGPRRAGVSSFGIGGTNAHVILQEGPARPDASSDDRPELLVLSARSEEALKQAQAALARHLRARRDLDLAAVAQTLGLGRRAHGHRLALVADGTRGAAMALALGDGEGIRRGVAGEVAPVLVLTGETSGGSGAGWGMGPASGSGSDSNPGIASGSGSGSVSGPRELYAAVPAYRDAVDACAEAVGQVGGGEALLGGEYAGFAHVYGVVRTLVSWGVAPGGLAGTGVGLAVAAAVSDALALPDALALAVGSAPLRVSAPSLPVLSATTGARLTQDPDDWTGGGPVADGAGWIRVAPDGLTELLSLAGELWVRGADLDFTALHSGRDIRRVPLPTHRFERRRHWVEPGAHTGRPSAPERDRLLTRFDVDDPAHNVGLVTDFVTDEVGKVLGGRHLAALDTNLFDLGLDSLVLIEVVAKLGEELDFEVPATAFVEFPTIRSFVDNLAELMGLTQTAGTTPAAAGRTSRRAQRAEARRAGQG